MGKLLTSLAFVLLLLSMAAPVVFSQKNNADKIWQFVAAQLDQQPDDTSRQHILLLVRGHCGGDWACQFEIYEALRSRLEQERFDLPAAIFIAEEMVRVAQKEKNHKHAGAAHLSLSRYHDARGDFSAFMRDIENALKDYEQAGEKSMVLRCKFDLAETRFLFEPFAAVYPNFRPIIEEAERNRDTMNLMNSHFRLMQHCFDKGQFDCCEKHLQAVEALAPLVGSDPAMRAYTYAVTAKHRAELATQKGDYAEAKKHWLRALDWARKKPDLWLEASISRMLAAVEWQTGQPILAKKHLESAEKVATGARIDELLAPIFALKSSIAEAEGKPAQALEFKKKEIFHQEEYKKRGAGFDFQAHFLKSEKERQKADLEMKNLQLKASSLVLLLVLAIVAGLALAYRNQKKSTKKLAEQKALIQKQAEELQNLDAAKSQFFANVSHELRTPLSLILGPIATLLKENQPAEKQKHLLKMAAQNGAQLQQLVNEILDLSKLEAGKMTTHPQPTELVPFFRRHLALFESLAAANRVHFSFEVLMENGATAKLDQAKTRQILSNLLANAFKFTPAGGSVRASLSLEKAQILIEIADSGAGIHPDDLPHLFERYFQTKRTDRPASGGTGIGLALCREHAALLGGKIWAESALGEGSKFFVALPVLMESQKNAPKLETARPILEKTSAPLPAPSADRAPKPALKSDKPRLLVVEDNPELRDYLRIVLEGKYHVELAENGQVALEKIAAGGDFRLILSDLMMPVMDGRQLAEKLKSEDATRHLPLVMLTARAGQADKLEALRLGVDDYLSKPFAEEELLARIENLLKNQSGRQQFLASSPPEGKAPVVAKEDLAWLSDFEKYLEKHLADPDLAIPQVATDFAMSESSLLRQLKRLTGLSTVQYLQEARLSAARRLLENKTFKNVEKVVSAVGYGDVRNFSRSFKKRFGRSPSEYLSL